MAVDDVLLLYSLILNSKVSVEGNRIVLYRNSFKVLEATIYDEKVLNSIVNLIKKYMG